MITVLFKEGKEETIQNEEINKDQEDKNVYGDYSFKTKGYFGFGEILICFPTILYFVNQ